MSTPSPEAPTATGPDTPAPLTPRQIITAMSGLMIAMLLAQLDNMIVAPALPTIVGDLGGLEHLSWVVTGYILASTISTPIWGKLGDLFGHKFTFMISIVLFLIGSGLCGMSRDMTELVLFRAFQGIGAGGLMVGIMSVIAMMVSPRERGKYIGVMMAVMPVAMIGGPLIGGFITDNLSWRWAFYVNLPLGIVSLFVIMRTLRLPAEHRPDRVVIDWWGAGLLSAWTTATILVITWGGNEFAWSSWQAWSLIGVAAVGLVAFLLVESRAEAPIIPLHVFAIRNFALSNAMGFVAGFAMFGAITFLPQYQQFVQGQSATNSGLLLMPMMIAAMTLSLLSGQIISRTGHYRSFPIIGTALLAGGLALFATMDIDTSTGVTAIYMVILGAGMGCLMQTTNLIAQNSVSLRDMGSATGAITFTRTMGGSLGVAVLGAVYTHQLTSTFTVTGAGGTAGGDASGFTPEAVRALPDAVRELFQQAVVNGNQAIYLIGAVVGVVGFGTAWFIKTVPLRDSVHGPPEVVEEAEALAV